VQLVYERLRAETVGGIAVQALDASWRQRWERFGLLGLFTDVEPCAPTQEPIGGVHLQGAAESAESWRKALEVYRSVIDKSLDDIFSRRVSDELIASPCGDLRESVFSTPKETVDDPEPSYAVAFSS
jgi:hypothetical protein